MPMQADSRSGQLADAERRYPSSFDFPPHSAEFAPDGHAFFIIYDSPYAGPDALLIGVPSTDKLHFVEIASSFSVGWSPDSKTLAYVYYAASSYHLATVDHAGNNKRIQSLAAIGSSGMTSFAGWSADGKYLAVLELNTQLSSSTYQMDTYYFINADSLQALPKSVSALVDHYTYFKLNGLAWSPQGHRFAYIGSDTGTQHLVIATPDDGIENSFDVHREGVGVIRLPLVWSPDGRYVAISGYTFDKERFQNGKGLLWEYWTHSIFGVDDSIHTDIKGQKFYPSRNMLSDGQWAADGSTWIFRQQLVVSNLIVSGPIVEETDENLLSYLTAYHVETASSQVIADHVAQAPLWLEGSDWLAVPIWSEGKINVELYEAASLRATIDHDFDEIIDMTWLTESHAFAYIARTGAAFTFGIIDLDTGITLIQLDGFPEQSFIQPKDQRPNIQRLALSPSGRTLLLRVGQRERQSIIIISLMTRKLQPIRMEGYKLGDIYWSPEGLTFAFLQYDDVRKINTLQIVSAEGETIHQIDLLNENSRVVRWTWCK